MVDSNRELQEISDKIHKKYEKLLKARKAKENYETRKKNFYELFSEKKATYLVSGIACTLVLVFDYFVSHETLQYLARIIRIQSSVLALIFTLLDAALASLASGGLAGNNTYKKELQRKIFRPILLGLGILKLILFGLFVHDSYLTIDALGNRIFPLTTWEFLRVILPQTLFIFIVYSVLTFAGLGLFYLVGGIYFFISGFLLENPEDIEKHIRELFSHFRHNSYTEFEPNLISYGLREIYNDVNQIRSNLKERKYEQN